MEIKQAKILGQPVHIANMEQVLNFLVTNMAQGKKQLVIAQNPEKVMKSLEDKELEDIINNKATLLITDGIGIVLAGKLLGLPPIPRVTGVGLFEEMIKLADKEKKRIFLYGAAPEVVNNAGQILAKRYPNLTIAGIQDGFEKDMDKVIANIELAKPDYLFVALGSPRQEKWLATYFDRLPIQYAMGVGGTFDVLTGNVKRAPEWMQSLGLEWFYRLIKQPSRAKRMTNLPKFLWRVIKSR